MGHSPTAGPLRALPAAQCDPALAEWTASSFLLPLNGDHARRSLGMAPSACVRVCVRAALEGAGLLLREFVGEFVGAGAALEGAGLLSRLPGVS